MTVQNKFKYNKDAKYPLGSSFNKNSIDIIRQNIIITADGKSFKADFPNIFEKYKLPRVSYSLSIDNPPIFEGDKAGVSSLLGAMLGNGSTNIPKDEFNEEIDYLGATLSFGSQGAFASTLSKYSERVLELLADR